MRIFRSGSGGKKEGKEVRMGARTGGETLRLSPGT
jgi:hypothetical protein